MEAQCWICPNCHDDHAQGAACQCLSPLKEFSPSPDDDSFIAQEYRKMVAERDAARAEAKRYRMALEAIYAPHAVTDPGQHYGCEQGCYCDKCIAKAALSAQGEAGNAKG
jgi:hypothetical protein